MRGAEFGFMAGSSKAGSDCKHGQRERVALAQVRRPKDGDSESIAKVFVVVGIGWLWVYVELAARGFVGLLESGELRGIVATGHKSQGRDIEAPLILVMRW
jgi:hypothetical protein